MQDSTHLQRDWVTLEIRSSSAYRSLLKFLAVLAVVVLLLLEVLLESADELHNPARASEEMTADRPDGAIEHLSLGGCCKGADLEDRYE